MSFLEYMGFVLVVFPLKCGSIIVQIIIVYILVTIYDLNVLKIRQEATKLSAMWPMGASEFILEKEKL